MSVKAPGMVLEFMEEFITEIMEVQAWIGAPVPRTLSLDTAYQATDPTEAAFVTVNLSSTAQLTLGGGQTHTAQIVIGETPGVAGGTGTIVARYRNSQTGTVVVGIALNAASDVPCVFFLPAGWYWAVRATSGSPVILSATDQALG